MTVELKESLQRRTSAYYDDGDKGPILDPVAEAEGLIAGERSRQGGAPLEVVRLVASPHWARSLPFRRRRSVWIWKRRTGSPFMRGGGISVRPRGQIDEEGAGKSRPLLHFMRYGLT